MLSTALNPTPSVWISLIPFGQTILIIFVWQSTWNVVYAVQIQRRECQKLLMNGQHLLYFLAEAIPVLIYIKFSPQANNRGNYEDGFYNSIIDDKNGHIPVPLIMLTCTALRYA